MRSFQGDTIITFRNCSPKETFTIFTTGHYFETFYEVQPGIYIFGEPDIRELHTGNISMNCTFPANGQSNIFINGGGDSYHTIHYEVLMDSAQTSLSINRPIETALNPDGTISFFCYTINYQTNIGFCCWLFNQKFNIGQENYYSINISQPLTKKTFTLNRSDIYLNLTLFSEDTPYNYVHSVRSTSKSDRERDLYYPDQFPTKNYRIRSSYLIPEDGSYSDFSYEKYTTDIPDAITIPNESLDASIKNDTTLDAIKLTGDADVITAQWNISIYFGMIAGTWKVTVPPDYTEIHLPVLPDTIYKSINANQPPKRKPHFVRLNNWDSIVGYKQFINKIYIENNLSYEEAFSYDKYFIKKTWYNKDLPIRISRSD